MSRFLLEEDPSIYAFYFPLVLLLLLATAFDIPAKVFSFCDFTVLTEFLPVRSFRVAMIVSEAKGTFVSGLLGCLRH